MPLELACVQPCLEHLVDLFEGAVFRFRKQEVYEHGTDDVGAEPYVAVSGAPGELGGVDEVGCGESASPVAEEVDCCGDAEGEGSQLVVGEFAADEPGVWGCWGIDVSTLSVAFVFWGNLTVCNKKELEQADESDNNFRRRLGAWLCSPYNGKDKLTDSATEDSDE